MLHARIAQRARELWEQRERVDGHADEDWVQAEAEIKLALGRSGAHSKPAFIRVKVKGTGYTGECDPFEGDYKPGDLKMGEPVTISIKQQTMRLKLPNGRELATRIVPLDRV